MCTILVRSSLLGHVTGGTNGLFSIFRRLIEGQQGLGCWYYSSNTQLCILTDMATPLLSCHHAMNGRVDEEQLSGRTWPGYIDAAQKLLEMMLTISINLSVTSTISKSSLSLHNWEYPFPGTSLPICLHGLCPVHSDSHLAAACVHLSPLGCTNTFYWIECKTKTKAYSWCNMSDFLRASCSVEIMLKYFQWPVIFWCQNLVQNSVLIFRRIYGTSWSWSKV